MLSAAVSVLLAAPPMAALADVTINSATTTGLATTASGNITIENTGSIALKNNGAVLSLDSNNFINNSGLISNLNNSGSIGIQIDTTDHNVIAASPGLVSTNAITISGEGTNKVGVLVTGGRTYFGNITLTNSTGVTLNGAGATIVVQGDGSSAFRLSNGTKIDGDVTFGGSVTGTPGSATSTVSNTLFLFDGVTNGNVYFDSTTALSNIGSGARGVVVLGGIHSCASDSAAVLAAGYTCPSGNGKGLGALINAGRWVTVGQVAITNTKDTVLEGGSVLIIGNSIDGGFYNTGPATAAGGITSAVISGNGVNGNSVLLIDPNQALTTSGARGPINIGPLSSEIDSIDPGYSILNRGTIIAQPTMPQLSSSSVFIQGASSTYYTCLGTGDFNTCSGGGILNTGTISALANTNIVTLATTQVNATAFTVGPYAYIPRLDVRAETTGIGSTTAGIITANVSGTSGGTANAVIIAQNAKLPTISVGQGATIIASVDTSTVSPTVAVGNSASPFVLAATAITDASSTLTTINNAGTIKAAVTAVTPAVDTVVATTVRAIDLTASTASNVTINNSGKIVGDLFFGAGGNNYTLNVGNTGASGAGNPAILALNMGGLNTPNNYAVVAGIINNEVAGASPGTTANTIDFGAGTGHVLHVGAFGYVNSVIRANPGAVAITVDNNGLLFLANTNATGSVNAATFTLNGGTLGLTVSQNTTATTPVIRATGAATISATSTVAMQFGSFISSGTTRASVDNPTAQEIVLISAPSVSISATTLAQNNLTLSQNLPFLFKPDAAPLRKSTAGGNETLVLSLTPRVPGIGGSTDATAGLGLSGDALAQFPYVASALATDSGLGAAIATSLTVYKTPGVSASGINVAASQQAAQRVFSQFGPDTSGGARQVAIMITDQATGPVAARQRLLRTYTDVPGEMTLWGQEFFGNINNKGRVSADGSLTNYKDHGFGFTLGIDGGSPRGGWYGGAFTFYSGDVTQSLPRNTQTHTQWYMLTGYSQWKGRRLFVDTQMSFAYGDFVGKRDLVVGSSGREAQGKRAVLMGALGGKMGAIFGSRSLQFLPQLTLDGLTMREEGYTETGGGNGFNLQVAPYYANSLRAGLGLDIKTGLDLWGFRLSPEARFGYRYDLVNSPVKLRAGFVSTGGITTAGNDYTFIGPDPDTGSLFGGLSLGAGTESWHLGVNFDMLRGNNGSTTQVGTVTLLGRI
jgi:hypothetical protein